MSGTTNQGVVGYISNPVASFPANSITVDIFGNSFYRSYEFGAGDDTGVYWNDQQDYSPGVMLFIAATIGKSLIGKFLTDISYVVLRVLILQLIYHKHNPGCWI